MELHIPTLALVAVFITVILGALLLLAWHRDQSTSALGWWGLGYLLGGMSFTLLAARGVVPDVLSIEIANALLLLGYSFLFAGARAFGGRAIQVTVFLVAPLIWLIAMRVPAIAADINLRVIVVSTLQVSLIGLMAHEFWRERAEPLLSRWPAVILLLTHIVVLGTRMLAVTLTPVASHQDFFRSPAFAMLAFGSVLYTITFAFLLLSMTKERTILHHKTAALVDPLTGLANRRAFMADADTAITALAARNTSFAILLADLDYFKRINDAFGHAVGDRVLTAFAATLRRNCTPGDLASRIGGEEFALLLPARDEEAARRQAELLRHAFARDAAAIGGHAVAATVSIGVATSRIGARDLGGLLGRADMALYQAKQRGRDRVVVFGTQTDTACDAPVAHEPMLLRLAG